MDKKSNTKKMISLDHIQVFRLNDQTRDRIKYLIEQNNTSYAKISKSSNGEISTAFLKKLLSGKQDGISKEKFYILCDALNVEIEEVLTDSVKLFSLGAS